jgi:hypothetical protein
MKLLTLIVLALTPANAFAHCVFIDAQGNITESCIVPKYISRVDQFRERRQRETEDQWLKDLDDSKKERIKHEHHETHEHKKCGYHHED